jgi:preprotein translocase subunit Sec61beta
MAKQQTMLPSSSGGIMRYFSDYKSKLVVKPDHVVFATIILVIAVIILHAVNP